MNHSQICLLACTHPQTPYHFIEWLQENEHIWVAFRDEALKMTRMGYSHYSSQTIFEYLRHHSAISENTDEYKLNNSHTPYLARLFAMAYPEHAGLFEYRSLRTVA